MKTLESILSTNMDDEVSISAKAVYGKTSGRDYRQAAVITVDDQTQTYQFEPGENVLMCDLERASVIRWHGTLVELDMLDYKGRMLQDAEQVFSRLRTLKSFKADKFEGKALEIADSAFSYCHALKSLSLPRFVGTSLVSAYSTFNSCSNLTSIDLPLFVGDDLIDVNSCFERCSSLKELVLPRFTGSHVSNCQYMLHGCRSLERVSLPVFKGNRMTDFKFAFAGCEKLYEVEIPEVELSDKYKTDNLEGMFGGCGKLRHIVCTKSFQNAIKKHCTKKRTDLAIFVEKDQYDKIEWTIK